MFKCKHCGKWIFLDLIEHIRTNCTGGAGKKEKMPKEKKSKKSDASQMKLL